MSSAINHKKRSRRGYKMQRTYLAPKNSPMINLSTVYDRKKHGLLHRIFRRMMGLAN